MICDTTRNIFRVRANEKEIIMIINTRSTGINLTVPQCKKMSSSQRISHFIINRSHEMRLYRAEIVFMRYGTEYAILHHCNHRYIFPRILHLLSACIETEMTKLTPIKSLSSFQPIYTFGKIFSPIPYRE